MQVDLNYSKDFYYLEAVNLVNNFYNTAPEYIRKNKDGCLEYCRECANILCDRMIKEYTISSGGEAPGFDAYAKYKVSQWNMIKAEIDLL